MAMKRVIAYYMHEREQSEALRRMSAPEVTDSFAIGEMNDNDIEALRRAGLIVQEQQAAPPPEEVPQEVLPGIRPHLAMAGVATEEPIFRRAVEEAHPAAVDYYLVRLRGPLLEVWRDKFAAIGVTLLEWVPDGGFKARLRREQIPLVQALDFVERVSWISPANSAPKTMTSSLPALAPGQPSPAGLRMVTYDVRLHLPEDRKTVEDWLRGRNVSIAGSSGRKIRFYVTENSPALDELGALPEVDTVAEYVAPELFNDAARRLLCIDGWPGQNPATCLTQDGAGQIVAVADTGIDDEHPDFQGRIVGKVARGRPNDTSDPLGHGTHVAGSVLGDGAASNGQIKGAAPKAQLFFQSLLDAQGGLGGLPLDLNDLFDEAYRANARIHNNSWGSATASIYTINSEEVDEFVHSHPDMLIVIAAGNEGTAASPVKAARGFVDWLSIGSPASCKNALTVGASRSDRSDGALSGMKWVEFKPERFPYLPIAWEHVSGNPDCLAAFSSRGPCDDRRIKPDVVAPGTDIASTKSSLAPIRKFWGEYPATPGQPKNPRYAFDGGTSMAAPLVSGCAALIRQYYVQDRKHEPSAALLKATLINGTQWLLGKDSTAPTSGEPNYHQGHGRICMELTIPNAWQQGLRLQFVDEWKTPSRAFTRTGARRRFQFQLPADTPALRICMAYTDLPARGLQNNLNLMVQHAESGKKWLGNAGLPDALVLPDPDNNVETVRVDGPPAGTYYIQVFAGNLLKPPQDFALVVTGYPVSDLSEI